MPEIKRHPKIYDRVGINFFQDMIKRLIMFVVAVAMTISASAQAEAGKFTLKPNVGVTYTTGIVDGLSDPVDGALGLTAGVEAMYMLNDRLGIALGLNYTGYNVDDDDIALYAYCRNYSYYNYSYSGSYSDYYSSYYNPDMDNASNYYFNIPATVNYYIFPGFAVKGGLAFNILSTAKVGGKSECYGVKVKDLYKSLFVSVPVGVSYEIKNFVFDARCACSLSNVCEYGDGMFLSFSLTAGYKF